MTSQNRLSPAQRRTGFGLFAGHLLSVWGLALSNGLMGLLMVFSIVHRRRLPWSWQRVAPIFVPAGFCAVFYIASTVTSEDFGRSAEELRDLLSWATLLLAPVFIRGETAARRMVNALLVMIGLLAVVGLYQYYFTDYGTLHRRIVGLFSHVQTFAGVLLIGLLAFAARLASGDGWRSPWNWVGFGAISWTLLLTLTRGAWVAAAVTLVVLALVRAKRLLFVAVIAALVALLAAPGPWTDRLRSIANLEDASNYDRLCMAEAALYMIGERPLFGIGPELVEERYPIYRHPTAPRVNVPHLHNAWLQRAAEQGLLSLAALLALVAAVLAVAVRDYRREGGAIGPRADLHLAVILTVVGFSVAGLFEDNWRDTEVRRLMLFFFALPLCLGVDDAEPELDDDSRAEPSDDDEP